MSPKSNRNNQRKITRSFSGIPQVILGQGHSTIDAWGVPKFTQDYSIAHILFTYDLPQRTTLIYENDIELLDNDSSTKAYSEKGALVIKAGTILNDNTKVRTKASPRYQPNRGHKYSVSTILDSAYEIGSTIEFGIGTEDNRVNYEVSDGVLYAVIVSGGIVTKREKIEFPIDWNVDLTKNHIADIVFQFRGVGNYKFFWGNPNTGYPEKIHEIKYLNREDDLSNENPGMPIYFKAINNGYNSTARFGCADISSEGGGEPIYEYTRARISRTSVGTDEVLFAVRIPDTYKGKELTRDFILERISADSDKKGIITIFQTRDDTCLKNLGANLIDTDWNYSLAGSSLQETLVADSYDSSKAIELRPITLQANITTEISAPSIITYNFTSGDILFAVGSFASAEVNLTIEFGEEI